MSTPEITLKCSPIGNDGQVAVTAKADGRTIHAAEIGIDDTDARDRFAAEVSQKYSEADPNKVAAELGKIARELARRPHPIMLSMADVEPCAVTWLWPNRIPSGRLTLLVGRPGEGKSFLSLDIAARVSTGSPWPDGSGNAPKGSVLLVTAEDDPADTIRPRLDAHHADPARVHQLAAIKRPDGERLFQLADTDELDAAMKQLGDCKMVVVDPVGSFLGGGTDAHRDNEVRAVLAPVAALAEKHGAAVIVVAHRRKSSGGFADDSAIGSRAFTGIARAVWHVSRDPHDRARRLLLPGKNNLGPELGGLAFSIGGEPARIFWEADPVELSADDGMAQEAAAHAGKPGPEPETRNAAAEWLADLLSGRAMFTADIQNEAKEAGFSWRTTQRAADQLHVVRTRNRVGEGYTWTLPDDPPGVPSFSKGKELGILAHWDNEPENAVLEGPGARCAKMPESKGEPGTLDDDPLPAPDDEAGWRAMGT